MACKCISYNQPEAWQTDPEVVLNAPDWVVSTGLRKTVCVDRCIAQAVHCLWDAGVWTIGSCCGHGDLSKRSVIVGSGDREKAREVLDLVDASVRVGAWELSFDGITPKEPDQ